MSREQMEYGASFESLWQGHIDPFPTSIRNGRIVAAAGANILVDNSGLLNTRRSTGPLLSRPSSSAPKFVKNNPETMQKFANAIVRAMIWINKNSNETVAKTPTSDERR